jgi:hypothetical protein
MCGLAYSDHGPQTEASHAGTLNHAVISRGRVQHTLQVPAQHQLNLLPIYRGLTSFLTLFMTSGPMI